MSIHRSTLPGLRFDKTNLASMPQHEAQLGPCLFVSRETGAGGSEIARRIAEQLHWQLLDKGILDELSTQYGTSRFMLDVVDEKSVGWLADILNGWVEGNGFSQLTYVHRLQRLLVAAAVRGGVVMVGRGARFMLPQEVGFSVRIVAPLNARVRCVAAERGISTQAARTYVEYLDKQRNEFVEKYFHQDATDPHAYDLVLNTERLGLDGSVSLLLSAIQSWQESRNPAIPSAL